MKLDIDESIIQFTKEGLGIRSRARILKKRIVSIARSTAKPLSAPLIL